MSLADLRRRLGRRLSEVQAAQVSGGVSVPAAESPNDPHVGLIGGTRRDTPAHGPDLGAQRSPRRQWLQSIAQDGEAPPDLREWARSELRIPDGLEHSVMRAGWSEPWRGRALPPR